MLSHLWQYCCAFLHTWIKTFSKWNFEKYLICIIKDFYEFLLLNEENHYHNYLLPFLGGCVYFEKPTDMIKLKSVELIYWSESERLYTIRIKVRSVNGFNKISTKFQQDVKKVDSFLEESTNDQNHGLDLSLRILYKMSRNGFLQM